MRNFLHDSAILAIFLLLWPEAQSHSFRGAHYVDNTGDATGMETDSHESDMFDSDSGSEANEDDAQDDEDRGDANNEAAVETDAASAIAAADAARASAGVAADVVASNTPTSSEESLNAATSYSLNAGHAIIAAVNAAAANSATPIHQDAVDTATDMPSSNRRLDGTSHIDNLLGQIIAPKDQAPSSTATGSSSPALSTASRSQSTEVVHEGRGTQHNRARHNNVKRFQHHIPQIQQHAHAMPRSRNSRKEQLSHERVKRNGHYYAHSVQAAGTFGAAKAQNDQARHRSSERATHRNPHSVQSAAGVTSSSPHNTLVSNPSMQIDQAFATDSGSASSNNVNTVTAGAARNNDEDASMATGQAVSKMHGDRVKQGAVGLHTSTSKAEDAGRTGDDIHNEASDVEKEEAEIMAGASGSDLTEKEDEEFEDDVQDSPKETVPNDPNQAAAENEQMQLAEDAAARGQENADNDDGFAQDINGEAKEIEDEDSRIERESLEEEQAGAELEENEPEVSIDDPLPAVKAPPRAAHRHSTPDNIKQKRHQVVQVSSSSPMAVQGGGSSGGPLDAMRKALAATTAATKSLPGGLVSKTQSVPTQQVPAAQNNLVGATGSGPAAIGETGSGSADATSKHALIHMQDNVDNGEVDVITEEGDRGDKNLDAVEQAIVSEQADASQSSDHATSDPEKEEASEGLDDVEAGIADEGDAEGASSDMADDAGDLMGDS